ncbi:hypothetical protein OEZ86_012531 [Tetradesmus obliquus]|nr:hypothetical protein OEZ86_012531 [Tetradesmus obliquus]
MELEPTAGVAGGAGVPSSRLQRQRRLPGSLADSVLTDTRGVPGASAALGDVDLTPPPANAYYGSPHGSADGSVLPGLQLQEQEQQQRQQQQQHSAGAALPGLQLQEQEQQQRQQQQQHSAGAALLARLQQRATPGGAGQASRQPWHELQQQQQQQQQHHHGASAVPLVSLQHAPQQEVEQQAAALAVARQQGPNGTLRNAGISVEAKLGVTHKPAKLGEKMPHPGVWERAFLETLRAMAKRGLVTLETLPRWQVHFAAWQALSELFQLLKNWGGFLAANHKVWMAMWERSLPPDADGGRVDVCLVMPYLLWRQQQHGSGGSGSGGSGGSGGGAPVYRAAAAAAAAAPDESGSVADADLPGVGLGAGSTTPGCDVATGRAALGMSSAVPSLAVRPPACKQGGAPANISSSAAAAQDQPVAAAATTSVAPVASHATSLAAAIRAAACSPAPPQPQQQQLQQQRLTGPGQQPLQQCQPVAAGDVPDHVDYGALLLEFPPLVRELVTVYPLSVIKQRAAVLLEVLDSSYAERWEWGDEPSADSSGSPGVVDDLQPQRTAAAAQPHQPSPSSQDCRVDDPADATSGSRPEPQQWGPGLMDWVAAQRSRWPLNAAHARQLFAGDPDCDALVRWLEDGVPIVHPGHVVPAFDSLVSHSCVQLCALVCQPQL